MNEKFSVTNGKTNKFFEEKIISSYQPPTILPHIMILIKKSRQPRTVHPR